MMIDKAKRVQRIFCVGLGICCIILALILFMLLFSTSNIAMNNGIALNVMIMLAAIVYYLLPVVGIIFLVLIIMYIIQMKKFNGKKLKMILEFVIPIVLIVLILIATLYIYINFGLTNTYEIKVNSKISEVTNTVVREHLQGRFDNKDVYVKKIILEATLNFYETIYYGNNEKEFFYVDNTDFSYLRDEATDLTEITQYSYRTLAVIDIFIIIFMYIKVSKQFKYIVQENLKEIDEKVQKNEAHEFSRENKRKILIFVAIVLVILVLIVLIMFAINSSNKSKLIENNNINHAEDETEDESNEIKEKAGQTYFVNENQGFMINLSDFWRDRYQVEILKTNDGGTTWEKVDSNLTEVYIETEFMFLDANIGFVHDPYGGIDSYDIVKMTNDGGKTWNDLKINKPDIITENNIFFKGLPTENNGELSIIAYTVDLGRTPKYKYFKFVSDDMGETWEFVKELD